MEGGKAYFAWSKAVLAADVGDIAGDLEAGHTVRHVLVNGLVDGPLLVDKARSPTPQNRRRREPHRKGVISAPPVRISVALVDGSSHSPVSPSR